jgi:hypothetical protein
MKRLYEIKINAMLFLISFVILFLAVRYFYIGFHNTDLVYNYQNLALQMNPYLKEANLTLVGVDEAIDSMGDGKDLFLSELYIKGNNQKIIGFTLMFFSAVSFALGLTIKEREVKNGCT